MYLLIGVPMNKIVHVISRLPLLFDGENTKYKILLVEGINYCLRKK